MLIAKLRKSVNDAAGQPTGRAPLILLLNRLRLSRLYRNRLYLRWLRLNRLCLRRLRSNPCVVFVARDFFKGCPGSCHESDSSIERHVIVLSLLSSFQGRYIFGEFGIKKQL